MESTAAALGATFRNMPKGASLACVDAYEQQIDLTFGNHYGLEAKYVTANVNLWPRPTAVVVNDATYHSLTYAQCDILEAAARNAVPVASEASRTQDDVDVVKLCGQDVTFPVASDQQLSALRGAVQTVCDQIARDPANGRMLNRLTDLKAVMAAAPDVAACPAPGHGVSGGSFPEGTYDMVLENDAGAKCPEEQHQGSRGMKSWFMLDVHDGGVTIHERIDSPTAAEAVGYNGVYTSLRDQVRIANLNATWFFDGTALRLSNMTGGSCGDAVIWTTHPWTLHPWMLTKRAS